MSRAHEYLQGQPQEAVLVLSVELCSLTFLPQETSMTQMVAVALFGDGAAAVLLCGDQFPGRSPQARILASGSQLLPESLDVMGWDLTDDGMRLVLSPTVPRVIGDHIKPTIENFLKQSKLKMSDVGTWLFHPGSAKILKACEEALGLTTQDTRRSSNFLEQYANLSSSSILFIIQDALKTNHPAAGSRGLVAAMGPGFACEQHKKRPVSVSEEADGGRLGQDLR